VREALPSSPAEIALVWRRGWKAEVAQIDALTAAWFQRLMQGESLGDALSGIGDSFSFERWLLDALMQGWVLGVRRLCD
jgi:hypothetical protein